MIKIVDRGREESVIQFTRSPLYRGQYVPELDCPLHVGYACPYCGNVIQAVFEAPHQIEFHKYEETNVYSIVKDVNETIRRVLPEFAGDEGNYKFNEYVMKSGYGYTLTLKNHVLNWKGLQTEKEGREDFFEVGERCCMYSSLISLRSEDLAKELAAVALYGPALSDKIDNLPTEEFLLDFLRKESSYVTSQIRPLAAIGDGPYAMLIPRSLLKIKFPELPSKLFAKWDEHQARQESA